MRIHETMRKSWGEINEGKVEVKWLKEPWYDHPQFRPLSSPIRRELTKKRLLGEVDVSHIQQG